jgi:hypothetical protein
MQSVLSALENKAPGLITYSKSKGNLNIAVSGGY